MWGGQVGYTNLNSKTEGQVKDIKFISKQVAVRSHRFPRSRQNGRIEAGAGVGYFPHGPESKTLCTQCNGPKFDPRSGN